jgi:uncharacterized membrane protein
MAQRVNESIEVEAPVEDVFRYWSNFENFSNFMQNVEEVRMTDADTSHWRVKGPLGKSRVRRQDHRDGPEPRDRVEHG